MSFKMQDLQTQTQNYSQNHSVLKNGKKVWFWKNEKAEMKNRTEVWI